MKKYRILVVEDNQKHLNDAIRVAKRMGIELITATDATGDNYMEGIIPLMAKWDGEAEEWQPLIDGVVTDIFMPLSQKSPRFNHDKNPCGLIVAAWAHKLNIPFVFCSSIYHHSIKMEWVHKFVGAMGWPHIVDMYPEDGDNESETDTKDWKTAFEKIINWSKSTEKFVG